MKQAVKFGPTVKAGDLMAFLNQPTRSAEEAFNW